ncbi:DUF1680 family protein [Paenibacillus sp. V4I3]|uniref:glycoside hydrolase family 127 protein n=1 Tax=Paenibacillus sp. V4I3 TaxID=3042305 RepID=UPI00277F3C56|nr:beta-L-arabinofuranosidase domain-containing protein [Paenibacillus sp. V4I3]MDQ0877383.1 DUF1680 family protein [Paenibacillus sp. V4I3]
MESRKLTQALPLKNVRIKDAFWSEYIRLVRDVVVPYQWEALNDRVPDAEPSHAIRNFKIAAGDVEGEFYGMVFQDSDVAKWLEAVGYLLETEADSELERVADDVIDLIARAQQQDGYLNTYYTVKEPDRRWTNLAECHELYSAGHMIEAAVAYYRATGKRKILEVACGIADNIDAVFGDEAGKLKGYDGHQEIELALVKLYHVTGQERYLQLSKYFLDERGQQPPHFYDVEWEKRGKTHHWPDTMMVEEKDYSQAHLPVREQGKADGHAVRLVYMCAGMADVAAETGDRELLEACQKLWKNIVSRRMYITGGIGSMARGEAFSLDYDLPNDTVYAETCASIGLIFFAQRMLQLEPKSEYADTMERALYNTVISGMSRDGKHFFYVNPLEVYPDACGINKNYDHVKPVRQGWYGCACCPPNVARLLASLGQYIYTVHDKTVYTHLYVGGQADLEIGGKSIQLEQQTNYPWDGAVRFELTMDEAAQFTLALRIPDWCDGASVQINGDAYAIEAQVADGYALLNRIWQRGDVVELTLNMPIHRMKGHPLVRQTAGKVALQRGPLVYCLEEADNGKQLHQLVLPKISSLEVEANYELLGGAEVKVIKTAAKRMNIKEWADELYKPASDIRNETANLTFIPYFAWANRGIGEMTVWVRDSE